MDNCHKPKKPISFAKKFKTFFIYHIITFVTFVICTQLWEGVRWLWIKIGLTANICILVLLSGLLSYYYAKYQFEEWEILGRWDEHEKK